MYNKMLAAISSLLVAAGHVEEPVCSHASCMQTTLGEQSGCALAMLQQSARVQRESSSIRDGGPRSRSGKAVVARINARFGNGRPSKQLDKAGVVVHAFDGFNSGEDGWFAHMFHWSASIINGRVPYMYLGNPENSDHDLHAGIVISPEFATASLLCSYDHDGVTTALDPCEGARDCVPGCVGRRGDAPTAPYTVRQWCRSNTTVQIPIDGKVTAVPADDHCAWPPNELDAMMEQHEVFVREGAWSDSCTVGPRGCRPYNEIVLDRDKLPHFGNIARAVEAIYFVTAPAALSREHETHGEKQAKAAQRLFLKMYGQTVPLVRFTSFSTQAPFELVSEASH